MVKIYYRTNCGSSIKTIRWMQERNIKVELRPIQTISKKDLTQCIMHSDKGFESVLKNIQKGTLENLKKIMFLEDLSFESGILFLQDHPELIRTPLILEKNKVQIGFNSEEIRQFIPKSQRTFYRKILANKYYQ